MKPSDIIFPAAAQSANDSHRTGSGPTKTTYVFVFVPVYIDQKTVASTPPHRRNLLLKLRRIFLRGDRRSLLPFWTWFIDNPRPASLK